MLLWGVPRLLFAPLPDLRDEVERIGIFNGELGLGLAFEIAPLIANVEHNFVALGLDSGARGGFVGRRGLFGLSRGTHGQLLPVLKALAAEIALRGCALRVWPAGDEEDLYAQTLCFLVEPQGSRNGWGLGGLHHAEKTLLS